MFKTLSAAVLCAVVSLPAAAQWHGAAGAGLSYVESGYRDADNKVWPYPAINIESENFYLHGFEAGTFLLKTEHQRVTVGLSYMPLQFDPDDSDNVQVQQLDTRHSSLFANVGYSIRGEWGVVNASLSGDIIGETDGLMADVNYLKRFSLGEWGLTPQVGLTWTSDKFNEYYYGITKAESARSGLASYTPDGSVSPYFRLFADWQFTDNWTFFAETSVRLHSDEVKDSPMMDKDTMTSFGCGVSYTF